MSRKLVGVLSAAAVVGLPVAGVAVAKPPKPPAKPHKCVPHAVAYRVSGALVSASVTEAGKNKANGTITITVTTANKAAKDAGVTKGSSQTYTLTAAAVHYAHNLTRPNPAAGTHVVVKGTITVLAKKCQGTSGAGQVTIKHVDFTPAPKHKH